MHEILAIVICHLGRLSVTWIRCAATAERIEVLFVLEFLGKPRNIQLESSSFFVVWIACSLKHVTLTICCCCLSVCVVCR